MTKTTCIFHRADFDGLFCREIARKFLPDAEFIGWDYGDPLLKFPTEGLVYVLDLSPDVFELPNGSLWQEHLDRLIWIDHHKTAIEKFGGQVISGYRIDGVAACRLAWQWFMHRRFVAQRALEQPPLPEKQAFIDRTVSEPYAVRLAGEYDIWDKRDPDAELFQHGLRSRDISKDWPLMLSMDQVASMAEIKMLLDAGHAKNLLRPDGTTPNPIVLGLLDDGRSIKYSKTQENISIINSFGFTINFEGFCLLACNAARYNSQLFTAALKPEHDGMLGFNWDGKQWRVSLYTEKPDVDLSGVAKKYGGGGHRGACGFRVDKLPFLP